MISVTISSDGTWLASGSEDGAVHVWDPLAGLQPAFRAFHSPTVNVVMISPMAPGSSPQTVERYGCGTSLSAPRPAFRAFHIRKASAVAIFADYAWLVIAGGRKLWIHDLQAGRQRTIWTGNATGIVPELAIAADCGWLAMTGPDNTIPIWTSIPGGGALASPGTPRR